MNKYGNDANWFPSIAITYSNIFDNINNNKNNSLIRIYNSNTNKIYASNMLFVNCSLIRINIFLQLMKITTIHYSNLLTVILQITLKIYYIIYRHPIHH